MVCDTSLGPPSSDQQPTTNRAQLTRASVGPPTSTDKRQPLTDQRSPNNSSSDLTSDSADDDQVHFHFPQVKAQTRKQIALEAYAETMTTTFEIYAEKKRVNFTHWEKVIAAVVLQRNKWD